MGQLTLLLTWACDMRCAHCFQAHVRTHLDAGHARRAINALHRYGEIDSLSFTGGEPFLRYPLLCELARLAKRRRLPFGVVTNGRWAATNGLAEQRIAELAAWGLQQLVVSLDDYHQAFLQPGAITALLAAARRHDVAFMFFVSRGDATPAEWIVRQLQADFGLAEAEIAIRDVAPIGHAASLPVSPLAQDYLALDKRCPSRDEYVIWPNGEVLPCCSAGTHASLSLGNLYREPVRDIVARRRASRVWQWLQQHDLGEIVIRLPEPLRRQIASQRYVHACHLCHTLMSEETVHAVLASLDPAAVSLIDKILASPLAHAELARGRRRWAGPPVVSL